MNTTCINVYNFAFLSNLYQLINDVDGVAFLLLFTRLRFGNACIWAKAFMLLEVELWTI